MTEFGLVEDAHAEARVSPAVPLFELCLLNDTEAFFGYYPVQEHTVQFDGESVSTWDLMGKDATLIDHSADNDPDSLVAREPEQ